MMTSDEQPGGSFGKPILGGYVSDDLSHDEARRDMLTKVGLSAEEIDLIELDKSLPPATWGDPDEMTYPEFLLYVDSEIEGRRRGLPYTEAQTAELHQMIVERRRRLEGGQG
jgi:hypothetical protein